MTTVYQYDPNGNTISKTTGTSQVRYYWDDEDKMVRLEDSVVMNFKWVEFQADEGSGWSRADMVCL